MHHAPKLTCYLGVHIADWTGKDRGWGSAFPSSPRRPAGVRMTKFYLTLQGALHAVHRGAARNTHSPATREQAGEMDLRGALSGGVGIYKEGVFRLRRGKLGPESIL